MPPVAIQASGFTVSDSLQASSSQDSCGFGKNPFRTGTGFTNSNGQWEDTYGICSTACARGGSCQTNAAQTWTANGIILTQPAAIVYRCNSITVNGN
jgi:hypothetical protein